MDYIWQRFKYLPLCVCVCVCVYIYICGHKRMRPTPNVIVWFLFKISSYLKIILLNLDVGGNPKTKGQPTQQR